MKTFTIEAWDRAANFLKTHARKLEKEIFAWKYEGAPADNVIDELFGYQNEDGGFGTYEPDIESDLSSVLNCTHVLYIAGELGVAATHPAIFKAMKYLAATYEPDLKAWPIIPRHDNSFPHAPWWECDENFDKQWNYFKDNPRPEVLMYLYMYGSTETRDILSEVEDAIVDRIDDIGEDGVPRDSMRCYIKLAQCPETPDRVRGLLTSRIDTWIANSVERDPDKWNDYCLKPIDVIFSATSPGYNEDRDALETNLDWEIENQADDGSWEPNWSWGGNYPESWERARVAWKGILTLERLAVLTAFGRARPSYSKG